MTNESNITAASPKSGWTTQTETDIDRLRAEIQSRKFDPDRPNTWAWDPWPDLDNAGRYRGHAQGQGSVPPFLDSNKPVRVLEAHAFWDEAGAQHHLLILPGDTPGALQWQWNRPAPQPGGAS